MELLEAMRQRHSVRAYTDQAISGEALALLWEEVNACNRESGLHIQLFTQEPMAFRSILAHYGSFRNVTNYIALVGRKGPDLEETAGYYGERLVLRAQQLGLNTCWVALTYSKGRCQAIIGPGEKLVCLIALGHGVTQGTPHKTRPMEALCQTEGEMPGWFRRGMKGAMMAPTAMNQQKFRIALQDGVVKAKSTGGFYSKVDLGIVKYHFEVAAGREKFRWG